MHISENTNKSSMILEKTSKVLRKLKWYAEQVMKVYQIMYVLQAIPQIMIVIFSFAVFLWMFCTLFEASFIWIA